MTKLHLRIENHPEAAAFNKMAAELGEPEAGDYYRAPCGWIVRGYQSTPYRSSVTCGSCKRSMNREERLIRAFSREQI